MLGIKAKAVRGLTLFLRRGNRRIRAGSSAQIFASGQRRALNFAVNDFERLSKNGFTKIPSILKNLIHFLCLIAQRDGKFVHSSQGRTFQTSKTYIMSGIGREDIDLSHQRIRKSNNLT